MTFCGRCGATLDPHRGDCPRCGHPRPVGWQPPALPPPPPPPGWAPPPPPTTQPAAWTRYPAVSSSQEAPWATPPPPRPPSTRRGWWWALGAAGLLFLAAGVFVGWWYTRDTEPSYPGEWDPRVADIAEEVAAIRDLDWEHPVHVEFLAEAEFEDEVTTEEADLSDEESDELEFAAGWYRALGLAEGEIDLLAQGNAASAGGIAAFYDAYTDRISVREPEGGSAAATSASDLPPDLRATLAHELTHALQDQQVDLTRLDDPDADSTLAFTFRAVVEGDASRVERAYVDALSEEDLERYTEASEGAYDGFIEDTDGVPPALILFQSAPYGLGGSFLEAVAAAEGQGAIDALLADPPVSEEHLLDPTRYLDGDQPIEMEAPKPPGDEEITEEGVFGSMGWYLLLAAHLDPMVALEATDGWGGDSYIVYDDGERACFAMNYRGDTDADTDEMQAALEQWQDALPDEMAQVDRQGGTITVDTCDPGPEAAIGVSDDLLDLLTLPVSRNYLLAGYLLEASAEPDLEDAACYAHAFVAETTIEELQSPEPWTEEELSDLRGAAIDACED